MKTAYLVSTSWWENDQRFSTILRIFDNREAAEGYMNLKRAHMGEEQKSQRTCYYLDTEPILSRNPLEGIEL